MRKREKTSILWAVALFFGLSLTAGHATADLATDKKPAKGKTLDACKVDSDCDQSSQPQKCTNGKCQAHRLPPPT